MKNNLFILIMLIFCKTSLALSSQKAPIYVKFGPDFLWSQSNDFSIQRVNPIGGTLNPSISPDSLNGGKWTGNVALGLTYPFSSTWHLSPEVSFLPLGNYSKSFNPFITGPYEGDDIINTFNATMKGNVVAAVINIDYLINI